MSVQVVETKIKIPYRQRDCFRPYHARGQRFAVNVCHRRAGKTVAAVIDLIRDCLRCKLDRPRVWYVAPTYSQAVRRHHQRRRLPRRRDRQPALLADQGGRDRP